MNVTPENFHSPTMIVIFKARAIRLRRSIRSWPTGVSLTLLIWILCAVMVLHYVGHPTRKVTGIEHNTGALGHGLSVAVGLALAGKMDGRSYRVFVLVGDGELAEGSNWEAAMAAAHHHLDNLVVIVDQNRLQISGTTEEITGLEPLADKFTRVWVCTRSVDGHNFAGVG